jgi:hypothetical protein
MAYAHSGGAIMPLRRLKSCFPLVKPLVKPLMNSG